MARRGVTGGGRGTTRDVHGVLHIKGVSEPLDPPSLQVGSVIFTEESQREAADGSSLYLAALDAAPGLSDLASRFEKAGANLWLVGGPVRDLVAGVVPKDFDCCTDALPEQTKEIVDTAGPLYMLGEAYGTIGVAIEGDIFEVTTLRGEQYGVDGRRPQVNYHKDIEADLRRRDFTINAQAIDMKSKALVDPFGGRDDLAAGVLRCPPRTGEAPASLKSTCETLTEDPLRIIRAIRFSSTRGYGIDPTLQQAMVQSAPHVAALPAERIAMETTRILDSPDRAALSTALGWSEKTKLSETVWGVIPDPLLKRQASTLQGASSRRAAIISCMHRQGVDVSSTTRALRWHRDDVVNADRSARLSATLDDMDTVDIRYAVRKSTDQQLGDTAKLYQSMHQATHPGLDAALADSQLYRSQLPLRGNDPAIVSAGLKGPQIAKALYNAERTWLADPSMSRDDLVKAIGIQRSPDRLA